MSEQVKLFRRLIEALQQDRGEPEAMAEVERQIREICCMAANKCPRTDLISLALFVADMGQKAARDSAEQN